MKVVIAPDSFKGSVSAVQAASAIAKGVRRAFAEADVVQVPVADGGEGTMETLVAATNGRAVPVMVTGPLGQMVKASYGVLGDQKTCVIEMAAASGLCLVSAADLDPMRATTYGTGELIKKALDDGFRSFILAIGGSATNDGGAGMLQALGIKLLGRSGAPVGFGGESLKDIEFIHMEEFDPRIEESRFLIASDVQNPLCGPDGASFVFGPQKGATPRMVKQLDEGLVHWANLVESKTGIRLHDLPGAGAAGGIGGAFQAFFPASMKRGVDLVIQYAGLPDALAGADLVITGEGQVDVQTASGKTPMGVAQQAQQAGIPTIVLAGSVGAGCEALYPFGVLSVVSIVNQPMALQEAMKQAPALLEQTAEQITRIFFYRQATKNKEADHGTAFDIAGQNKAGEASLKEAIRMAVELAPEKQIKRT